VRQGDDVVTACIFQLLTQFLRFFPVRYVFTVFIVCGRFK
jgi:hypothetical protein